MDHQQEQQQELEILTCIYAEDLEEKVPVILELPEKYPTEVFNMSVASPSLLSENEIEELLKLATTHNLENIGVPVVFDTMSVLQDKIYHFARNKSNVEELNVQIEQIHLDQVEESAAAVKPRVITCDDKINGTEVTVESFCKWKIQFELEHNIDYKKSPNDGKFDSSKLTGKQFFEQGLDDNATYLEMDGEMLELDEELYVENMKDIS